MARIALIDEVDHPELEELVEVFKGTRSDSMGMGTIIYWPRMEWPEGVEDGHWVEPAIVPRDHV